MSLLDIIWDFFRKPKPVPIPVTKYFTSDEMDKILKPYSENVWLSDSSYKITDKTALEAFMNLNPVNTRKYITESHDCDDFAYELMGDVSSWCADNTFGMMWGHNANGFGHAWNFFVDKDKKVWYVEPQTDEIFEPTKEVPWIMIC